MAGESGVQAESGAPTLGSGTMIAQKYRLETEIARGGMGVVWLARNVMLDQRVAVKVMLRRDADEERTRRFLREARATAALDGEHVARIYDAGTLEDGNCYIAMELLTGLELDDLIRAEAPLPVGKAVDLVLQACAGVAEAHARGIVHRDLKPSNLFVTERADGTTAVKVLDFGVAKWRSDDGRVGDAPTTTESGCTLGTPGYMSPEQLISSKDADARADVWSLGLVLFRLLTADSAFAAASAGQYYAAILTEAPRRLRESRPELPAPLDDAVARCLEREPDCRHQDLAQLARALEPFAERCGALVARIERVLTDAGAIGAPPRARQRVPTATTIDANAEADVATGAATTTDAPVRARPPVRRRAGLLVPVLGVAALGSVAWLVQARASRLEGALAVPGISRAAHALARAHRSERAPEAPMADPPPGAASAALSATPVVATVLRTPIVATSAEATVATPSAQPVTTASAQPAPSTKGTVMENETDF